MINKPIFLFCSLLVCIAAVAVSSPATQTSRRIPLPDESRSLVKITTRGGAGLSKLDSELQALYTQYLRGRKHVTKGFSYSAGQLRDRFGISDDDENPPIGVSIKLKPGESVKGLANTGAAVFLRIGNTVYARIPVLSLKGLVREEMVYSVRTMKAAAIPIVPAMAKRARIKLPNPTRGGAALPNEFDHHGFTGKGVIVGIVDSGIDWHHADFIRPDGTSRILYLWDLTDSSWNDLKGKVGTKPPYDADKLPLGTLYTNAQINAALAGTGIVNSRDSIGHGTACAGTAAGNGLAAPAGVHAGVYRGVAPDADLIIVKAGDAGVSDLYYLGTEFIANKARELHKPCVISQSFVNQDNAHDGLAAEEQVMNDIAKPGKPGVVICASAGNDGLQSFHAHGHFGPKRAGQADISSRTIQLFVSEKTVLTAYFSAEDDWGLAVTGLDNFFVNKKGESDTFYIYKKEGSARGVMDEDASLPEKFDEYFDTVLVQPTASNVEDEVMIPLPPGKYLVNGFGVDGKVPRGTFDLYLPFPNNATFGVGTDKQYMVGAPGNAKNVLTVGAYNFRKSWRGETGSPTYYNLTLGDLSDYSSPGFRRDGLVKPELAAPATYTISPLASDSAMGKDVDGKPDQANITEDGQHIAWSGTSASCPYAAGVVALILQKNPGLDEAQVKQILIKTARHDAFTGAVPNTAWGYGKINPAGAIAATPPKKH